MSHALTCNPSMNIAGMVKMMPAARSPPVEAAVCMTFVSFLSFPPMSLTIAIETTAVVTIGQ